MYVDTRTHAHTCIVYSSLPAPVAVRLWNELAIRGLVPVAIRHSVRVLTR
jgi:hypothetical protein